MVVSVVDMDMVRVVAEVSVVVLIAVVTVEVNMRWGSAKKEATLSRLNDFVPLLLELWRTLSKRIYCTLLLLLPLLLPLSLLFLFLLLTMLVTRRIMMMTMMRIITVIM